MNGITFCPQCRGIGSVQSVACPSCNNNDATSCVLALGEHRFYFDFKRISTFAIAKRRITVKIEAILNCILVFVGIVGVLFLGYYIYTRSSLAGFTLPLGFIDAEFWSVQNVFMRIFFFTGMTDLYLYYRIKHGKEREQYVLKRGYNRTEHLVQQHSSKSPKSINDSFAPESVQIVEDTYMYARENHFTEITPLHVLATLLSAPESRLILFRLGIHAGVLAGKIKHGLEGLYMKQNALAVHSKAIYFSPAAKQLLLQAYEESYQLGGGDKVSVVDLWIPIAEIEGYAKEILYDFDIESYKVRHIGMWLNVERNLRTNLRLRSSRRHSSYFSKHGMNQAMTAVETKFLNSFSRDLTYLSARGAIHPSLGHTAEMDQIFTVLQSGAKGVVLVGPPGIGKESMVEELAERMASDLVPEIIEDKRLLSLSVAGILAGGGAAGSSERLYRAFSEAAYSGNIVLFIKDIHNLVGVGLQGEAGAKTVGLDHVLRDAVESGRFLVIGTTDPKSYTRSLEHSSLKEVLTRIDVHEPEFEDTVLMLEARVPYIESKHQVFFTYQSLEQAVLLTNKFIHTEHQPEKAYKILQETAAAIEISRGRKSVVIGADIGRIISKKVGIPLTKIEKQESEKLIHLEEYIHEKYVNQEYAVKQASAALRRGRAELRDEKRPIANFLFVGPTGVGKTELVKRIANVYFNSENDMIRLDMSEFQEVSSIERLIGTESSPGLLTESVRANPYSVLLLDELEKAHPNILNIFLQVMDDGRLTSGEGEVVDFTNLIIVATSNAGTKKLQDYMLAGRTIEEVRDEFIRKDLLEFFRPEFINRFDDVIVFKPLSEEHIQQIAALILQVIAEKLLAKGITFQTTQSAVKELAARGFDPLFGARPLRRTIQDTVQNALANYLISGAIDRRDTVILEESGKIRIEKAEKL